MPARLSELSILPPKIPLTVRFSSAVIPEAKLPRPVPLEALKVIPPEPDAAPEKLTVRFFPTIPAALMQFETVELKDALAPVNVTVPS